MVEGRGQEQATVWQKLLRRGLKVGVTVVFLGAAGGMIAGGTSLLAKRASAVLAPEPAPLTAIAAMTISPQNRFVTTRRFHGQVEAAQSVDLAFEQPGEIAILSVDEGAQVERGDLLARLDTRLLDAERQSLLASKRALEAQAELARLSTDRQTALRERGFASEQIVDTNRLGLADLEARIAEIEAAIVGVDVRLSQTQIVAPFDGMVGERLVDGGAVVGVGQPVLSLLETSRPLFRVGIDPALASTLNSGAQVMIDLRGQQYRAIFQGFRPDLNAQTRTMTALFALETDDAVFLEAGTLILDDEIAGPGYALPLRALQDGVRGSWTVLTVEAADGAASRIGYAAVEVLQVEGDTAFVRGTLDGDVLIVADGLHRIVPGQTVRLISDSNITAE